MSYNILAVNPSHNGSCALIIDGEIVFYAEEERFSRMKYDGNPFKSMISVLLNHKIDEIVVGGTQPGMCSLPWTQEDPYSALVRKFNPQVRVTQLGHLHHLGHATSAFYGSGFETAAAVVVDGSGSVHSDRIGENGPIVQGYETESIYHCSYPHEFNAVYKRYSDGGLNSQSIYYDNGIQEFDPSVTITKSYEAVSEYLGFGWIEAGKTMGLSPYGEPDENIPEFFINGKGNKNLLKPFYPAGSFIDEDRYPYLKRFSDPKEWHRDFSLCREVDKNLAYKVQKETEEQMINLIQKAIDITGETNIVLSGGYALNCVANYRLIKEFPHINFYVDPIAHDGGTSIGLARFAWHNYSQDTTPKKLESVYLSLPPDYSQLDIVLQNITNLTVEDWVVNIDNTNYEADVEVIRQHIPNSPHQYRVENENEEELNEMRKRAGLETKKLYGEPDSEIKAYIAMAGL
jgi:carbamoyltransferase